MLSIFTLGPWAVGEVIEDNIGVIFVWGTFIKGSYLPGSFTYAYGFAQVSLLLIIIIITYLFKFPIYIVAHIFKYVFTIFKYRCILLNKSIKK